jgi:hypothetical protein
MVRKARGRDLLEQAKGCLSNMTLEADSGGTGRQCRGKGLPLRSISFYIIEGDIIKRLTPHMSRHDN